MYDAHFLDRRSVGHYTALNFLALAIPLALAFFIMPVAARYLGPARFGLLGLAWAVTEYLTLFDLGLGRALVKFVADALHHDSAALNGIVSLSMGVQVGAGLVGGAAFALGAPLLVHNVFRIPPAIAGEALGVFRVVGLSVPFVLLISGQRAVLEGAQRFDLSATLKMLGSLASLSIPAVGAVLGGSLPTILLAVLASRIIMSVLFGIAISNAVPGLRWVITRDWALARRVLSFGGWVLVSNTVSPLLVYFDRFALGTIAGLAAVGLYTAPYEGVTRMLLVPVSLFSSLLPVLTSIEARGDDEAFARLAESSQRVLLPVMALPLALVFVFAPELLRVWLGSEYAAHSTTALRILSLGVFANSLANPLMVMIYAKNRPDLPAKFHLAELAIHVPLTILLIKAYGIAGAAAAWTGRVCLDLSLLAFAAARTSGSGVPAVAGGRIGRSTVVILVLLSGLAFAKQLGGLSTVAAVAGVVVVVGLYAGGTWRWVLGDRERRAMADMLRPYFSMLPARTARG